MLLKILQIGDESLRTKARALQAKEIASPFTQQLIDLMIATLRDYPGVGLAAPQVGESLQIVVIEDKKKHQEKVSDTLLHAQNRKPIPLQVIINPKIKVAATSAKALFFEGCLGVEGYYGVVPRAKEVTVTGWDRNGKAISLQAEGWFARILQHEIDHLAGVIYVDTMLTKTFITKASYTKEWEKADPEKLNRYIHRMQMSHDKAHVRAEP